MPHKVALRNARMLLFEQSLETAKRIFPTVGGKTRSAIATRAKMKKNLLGSLVELERNHEHYEFDPTQLEFIKRLKLEVRKAKTPNDLSEIARLTCYLKLSKR